MYYYCIIYKYIYIYITCKSEYIFQMSSWRWHQHLNKAKDIIGRNTGFFFLIFQYTASLACQIFEWHTCTPWSEEASRVNRVNHHCHRWQILENVLKKCSAKMLCWRRRWCSWLKGFVPSHSDLSWLLLLKALDGGQGLFCSLQDSSRKKICFSRICWETFSWEKY